MSKERVLLILRNMRLLLNQLKLEIDDEYNLEHMLVDSMNSNLNSIEMLFGKEQ